MRATCLHACLSNFVILAYRLASQHDARCMWIKKNNGWNGDPGCCTCKLYCKLQVATLLMFLFGQELW